MTLGRAIAVTCLCALALGVPLWMQNIMVPHNEACWGPFTDADYAALLTLRLQTWAVSFIVTGLCLIAILWRDQNRALRLAIIALFALWKTATLFASIYASPMCWEPYANDTPFWDEPFGTGLAVLLQPLGFVAFALTLTALAVSKWGILAITIFKNRPNHGN